MPGRFCLVVLIHRCAEIVFADVMIQNHLVRSRPTDDITHITQLRPSTCIENHNAVSRDVLWLNRIPQHLNISCRVKEL